MTVYQSVVVQQARRISTPDRVEIAHQIASVHRGSAPVDTGAYRDGVTVVTSGDDVSVVNRDPDAKYKEYGTSDTPAHSTMTNAARQFGRYTGWGAR